MQKSENLFRYTITDTSIEYATMITVSLNIFIKGGANDYQPPISPLSKVKNELGEEAKCFASNFDTVVIGVYVKWKHTKFFEYLSMIKENAVELEREMPAGFINRKGEDSYLFSLRPHGTQGYEWLMYDKEYALKVGKWEEPIQRPSLMVDIRSETLWRKGLKKAVNDILRFLKIEGATIIEIIISRVDMCVDIILDESIWSNTITDYRVTRAMHLNMYSENDLLSGFMIGKGNISARIYDKALEIKQKSKKYWMFDVWGIENVPTGSKIIRIEFQLRREILKQVGVDTFTELLNCHKNLWTYCTRNWLKFQNNPGLHHTQRKTLPWWRAVQEAFSSVTTPHPLIRAKAISTDLKWELSQIYGYMTSVAALLCEFDPKGEYLEPTVESIFEVIREYIKTTDDKHGSFFERVQNKRAKFHRSMEKYESLHGERTAFGLPSSPFTIYWPITKDNSKEEPHKSVDSLKS